MSMSDFVSVQVSVSASTSPTVEAFGIPLFAAYHTKWTDRVRYYSSVAAAVADGFTAKDPVYKGLSRVFAQKNPPTQCAVGRRALPPTQTLQMTCTDTAGAAGNAPTYAFTVVGSDNKAFPITTPSTGVPSTDAATLRSLLAGAVVASGTTPPAVTITGTPGVANPLIEIDITTGGARDTALFTWKLGGVPQATGQVTAATFSLGATGLTANFPTGSNYTNDNVYVAQYLTAIGTVGGTSALVSFVQTAGLLNDLQGWTPNFTLFDATSDPGISTDLAAILAANTTGWYGLMLDSNSLAEVEAAADWCQATGVGGKYGFFTNSDTRSVTATSTPNDVFSELQGDDVGRCFLQYNGKELLSYAGASIGSYASGSNPGSYALSYKAQPLVPADDDVSLTDTQKFVLNTASTAQPGTGGRNGNTYKVVAGLPTLFPGSCPDGEWADVVIGIDWLQTTLQARVFAVLSSLPKVPLTDIGIGLIGDAISSVLALAASPAYGLLDGARPIVVTLPKAAAISPTDRQNRNVPGITFSAFLAGAVNTAGIKGVLTP